jgi:3',5'-cyclic AMP phosphodiesterase CpdA
VRIAHLSDLHLLALDGVVPFRLFNKRFTGYLNLRLRRKAVHKPFAVEAAARAIRELGVDHVVVTGDVSNLALEGEFALANRFFEHHLGMSPEQVTLVPGNHDAYTRGAHRSARFATAFARYLSSDLPGLTVEGSRFPVVRLRGPVAIIGLSTAVPRLPFVASGELGTAQLKALEAILEHPEVKARTPVILQHHPIHNPPGRTHAMMEGLQDAAQEMQVLRRLARGLVLHGHLHRRIHRTLGTPLGHLDAVGSTSASLLDERDDRMAGFNVYDFTDDGGVERIESHRLRLASETFETVALPRG